MCTHTRTHTHTHAHTGTHTRTHVHTHALLLCPILSGVLDKLFTLLYDQDVIGEDTFTLWEEGGREDLEGRGVALMSAKPFMDWLRSVDGQDGQ